LPPVPGAPPVPADTQPHLPFEQVPIMTAPPVPQEDEQSPVMSMGVEQAAPTQVLAVVHGVATGHDMA
jgi:hypothetical protein